MFTLLALLSCQDADQVPAPISPPVAIPAPKVELPPLLTKQSGDPGGDTVVITNMMDFRADPFLYNGSMPVVPVSDLRPIPLRELSPGEFVDSTWEQFGPLTERFEQVVATHPDPVFRRHLERVFKSGELQWVFFYKGNFSLASFVVDEQTGQPVMLINPVELAKIQDPLQFAQWWIVLYHEFIHYLQWFNAPSQAEKRFFVASSIWSHNVPPEYCRAMWKGERQAYYLGCRMSVERVGAAWPDAICQHSADIGQFDQQLLIFQRDFLQRRPECSALWVAEARLSR